MSTERHLTRWNGKGKCRWCGKDVKPPRRTFCNDACVHEYMLRASPSYVRREVYKRDRGLCVLCGTDVGFLEQALRHLKYTAYSTWKGLRNLRDIARWEADHIVPVVEGGGQCGLENYRTLCRACHKLETAALARRRAEQRRDQKCSLFTAA